MLQGYPFLLTLREMHLNVLVINTFLICLIFNILISKKLFRILLECKIVSKRIYTQCINWDKPVCVVCMLLKHKNKK